MVKNVKIGFFVGFWPKYVFLYHFKNIFFGLILFTYKDFGTKTIEIGSMIIGRPIGPAEDEAADPGQ